MRFDKFVSAKLGISRNKALEFIENESVLLNDKAYKPAFEVQNLAQIASDTALSDDELLQNATLQLTLSSEIYASRAALKLKGFLAEFPLDLTGKKCLDIGAAAGGFTQVLLENGAQSVLALDIGTRQLDEHLKNDKRVQSIENTDIKAFKSDEKFDVITCDISFVSLKNVLFCIDKFAQNLILLLFKPQFEVGINAKRDKKGVVKDEKAILKARAEFEKECASLGWLLLETSESKLKGKEGNVEFFYLYQKAKH